MSKVCIKNLKYKYKEDAADVLKGVSFEVPKGKVSALLGPNGSGKSTLFKILLKILIPYGGKIYIDGKDVDSIDASYLSKIMAWIPQEEDSFFPYTVYEYVLMGRAPHLGFFDVPNEEDEEVVYNVLHRLGLLKIAHRKVPSLSGGEKRLVSIARALAQESDILIMDEPTAHLDLGNKATVLSIVKKMADSGKTIFFSTHDPNEASFVADNVIILNGGEVMSEGPPSEAITREVLEKIWSIPIVICNVNDRPIISLNTYRLRK